MADLRLGLDGIIEGMDDQIRADVGVAEALCQPMRQRFLEALMVQDEREDEAAQGGLMPCNRLRFLADAVPDRIELLDGLCAACRITHSHGCDAVYR